MRALSLPLNFPLRDGKHTPVYHSYFSHLQLRTLKGCNTMVEVSGQIQHCSMVRLASRRRLPCALFLFWSGCVPYRFSRRQLVVVNPATRSHCTRREREERRKTFYRIQTSSSYAEGFFCAERVVPQEVRPRRHPASA